MPFIPINFVDAPPGWKPGDSLPTGATPLNAANLLALQNNLAGYVESSFATTGNVPPLTADTFQSYKIILLSDGTVRAIPSTANPPSTPTGLTVTPHISSVKVQWNPVSGAASYFVYRNGGAVTQTSQRTFRDLNATVGQTYTYAVQAVDQYGQRSVVSSTVSAFVDPASNVAPVVEVTSWPTTAPTDGVTVLRVNASDADAQTLALSLGVDAGTLTATSDPSVWYYTPTGVIVGGGGGGTGTLSLPLVDWDGGPDFYTVAQEGAKMTKAEAAGWSDPAFFPICVWIGNPDHAAHYQGIGINTYMMAEHTPPISDITNLGMSVITFMSVSFPSGVSESDWTNAQIGSDPGVVAYFVYDEAEQGEGAFWNVDVADSVTPSTDARRLQYFQSIVSARRGLNDGRFIANNFAKGVLGADHSGGQVIDQFIQSVDVSAVDFYVYTSGSVRSTAPDSPNWPTGANPDRAATYGWLIDQQKSFQSPAASQPAWGLVETKKPYLAETTADIILYAEIVGAAWSTIIHEARGLVYFTHNGFYPPDTATTIPAIDPNTGLPPSTESWSLVDAEVALQTAVASLNAKIQSLAPVINTQSYVWDFGPANVDTMLKEKDGYAYIFAQPGLNGSTGTKTFTLPPEVNGTSVEFVDGVGGPGPLAVTSSNFSVTFVHEYDHFIGRVLI